jgi:hypothetical protein
LGHPFNEVNSKVPTWAAFGVMQNARETVALCGEDWPHERPVAGSVFRVPTAFLCFNPPFTVIYLRVNYHYRLEI